MSDQLAKPQPSSVDQKLSRLNIIVSLTATIVPLITSLVGFFTKRPQLAVGGVGFMAAAIAVIVVLWLRRKASAALILALIVIALSGAGVVGWSIAPRSSAMATVDLPPSDRPKPSGADSPEDLQPSASPGPSAFERTSGDQAVALPDQYSLDLDAEDWVSNQGAQANYDLLFNALRLSAAKHLARVSAEPTYDDCVRASYAPYYEEKELTVGDRFCVKTDGGRYARIVIAEIQRDRPGLKLDIGIWSRTV